MLFSFFSLNYCFAAVVLIATNKVEYIIVGYCDAGDLTSDRRCDRVSCRDGATYTTRGSTKVTSGGRTTGDRRPIARCR